MPWGSSSIRPLPRREKSDSSDAWHERRASPKVNCRWGWEMSLRRKLSIIALVYVIEGFPMGVYRDLWFVHFRREGMSLAEIGVLNGLIFAWSAKVLWSPLVDRFGERRQWIAGSLLVMTAIVVSRVKVEPIGLDTLGGKIANLIEWLIDSFHKFAHDIAEENVGKFFPLFMTIFLFILVCNWWELVPGFDSIGFAEHPHEAKMTSYKGNEIGPFFMLTAEKAGHDEEGYILVPLLRAATDSSRPQNQS